MSRIVDHKYKAQPVLKNGCFFQCLKLIILMMIVAASNVQAAGEDYKLKAAYIYQFTKFTYWPDKVFDGVKSPIRICVLGDNPFVGVLNGFLNKTSQRRQLVVEYFISLENILSCQLVFISQSEEKRLIKILKYIERSPILSVSDINDFSPRGGIIGLKPKNRKIGIEINIDSMKMAGITISSKLLEAAELVKNEIQEKSP